MEKATNKQIIDAYAQAKSVWGAAKILGLCGQSVHERLKALGYTPSIKPWTDVEEDELKLLVDAICPIGEIARRLGRTYGAIATRISDMGLGGKLNSGRRRKIPRGAGYDKANIVKLSKRLARFDGSLARFCRMNTLHIDPFVKAFQKHLPDLWTEYSKSHTDLPRTTCPYCGGLFYPMTKKQYYCTRLCASHARSDRKYFGGKRRTAIGLVEGICQLCQQSGRTLSAHHVLGKENDPDNEYMVALCTGCHDVVTRLASRPWICDPGTLENLISLAIIRKMGGESHDWAAARVFVEVEYLTQDEDDEDEALVEVKPL